ncbi:hypothetical protein GFY24_38310 [Nocardia sp. SYP-A9097]|uniref:hypothetical protein n=1 Tax=Nocardia sp. SYP-A9097 TaxID=2663237 RepID=UPI001323AE20|nr:hypothetical protein [Nocardia sp. SYP-A9097]MRH93208.1 hypothetical protein [Nocardia sp. SYP-A9097]
MYSVDTTGEAQDQIDALPYEALLSFAEAFTVLEVVPWNGRPINPAKPDGAVRVLDFARLGLITYLIVESERKVDVLKVQWLG